MRLDRDGDGRISHGEYSAMIQRRRASKGRGGKDKFAKLDLNRDGFVTQDEIADRLARKYARVDQGAGRRRRAMMAPEPGARWTTARADRGGAVEPRGGP